VRLPENYRPVSLTSQVSKLFESILRDRIVHHLKANACFGSLNTCSGGENPALPTCLRFLIVTGSMDEGEAVDVVFLDLAKAFDKVPHQRLIKKLKTQGIEEIC